MGLRRARRGGALNTAMTSLKSSLLLAAALGLALGLTACGKKAKPAPSPAANARAVTLAVVESRAIEGGLIASGVLVPREDTAILPDVTGYRVARVLTDEGEWVKAGQPLATMDDSLLKAQVDQQVALGEDRHQHALEEVVLPDHHALDLEEQALHQLCVAHAVPFSFKRGERPAPRPRIPWWSRSRCR